MRGSSADGRSNGACIRFTTTSRFTSTFCTTNHHRSTKGNAKSSKTLKQSIRQCLFQFQRSYNNELKLMLLAVDQTFPTTYCCLPKCTASLMNQIFGDRHSGRVWEVMGLIVKSTICASQIKRSSFTPQNNAIDISKFFTTINQTCGEKTTLSSFVSQPWTTSFLYNASSWSEQSHFQLGVLNRVFDKTGNHFVETGYLPVTGSCDVMCHKAAVLERKAAGEVKCSYVITMSCRTDCVKSVVYSVTKHSLIGAI